jgi:hypothetical protein
MWVDELFGSYNPLLKCVKKYEEDIANSSIFIDWRTFSFVLSK